jgi:hypothetical protein
LSVPVEYGGLTRERFDLPSAEYDAVLSTWALNAAPKLESICPFAMVVIEQMFV